MRLTTDPNGIGLPVGIVAPVTVRSPYCSTAAMAQNTAASTRLVPV